MSPFRTTKNISFCSDGFVQKGLCVLLVQMGRNVVLLTMASFHALSASSVILLGVFDGFSWREARTAFDRLIAFIIHTELASLVVDLIGLRIQNKENRPRTKSDPAGQSVQNCICEITGTMCYSHRVVASVPPGNFPQLRSCLYKFWTRTKLSWTVSGKAKEHFSRDVLLLLKVWSWCSLFLIVEGKIAVQRVWWFWQTVQRQKNLAACLFSVRCVLFAEFMTLHPFFLHFFRLSFLPQTKF